MKNSELLDDGNRRYNNYSISESDYVIVMVWGCFAILESSNHRLPVITQCYFGKENFCSPNN